MKMTKLVPEMLDKSRFNRRLHGLNELVFSMFRQIGYYLKSIAGAAEYVFDSFPVAVCDNIRISRCKLVNGEHWRGSEYEVDEDKGNEGSDKALQRVVQNL
jgi:hypothetical protein